MNENSFLFFFVFVLFAPFVNTLYEEIISFDQTLILLKEEIEKQRDQGLYSESKDLFKKTPRNDLRVGYEAIRDYYKKYNINMALWHKSGFTYFMIPDLLKGDGVDKEFRNYKNALYGGREQYAKEILRELTGSYKIHLMPQHQDIFETIVTVLDALKEDSELQNLIYDFKSKINLENERDDKGNVLPLIVIYPSAGKENAQKALDKIYRLFRDKKGLDITPRFNQRVTSLIYFAQGDADHKKYEENDKYYELPLKIYYNPTITGSFEDYHLKIPNY